MEMFTNTLYGGLDETSDGETLIWTNPDTQAGGSVKYLESRHKDESLCRRVEITNRAKGREGNGIYIFCKDASDKWRVRP